MVLRDQNHQENMSIKSINCKTGVCRGILIFLFLLQNKNKKNIKHFLLNIFIFYMILFFSVYCMSKLS